MGIFNGILQRFVPSSGRRGPSNQSSHNSHNHSSSNGYYGEDSNMAASRGGMTSKSNSKTLHGVITSALWAIARTPAMVNAIERVETRLGEEKKLAVVLQLLGQPAVLRDSSLLREVTVEADAQLAASNLTLFDSMNPMDAIRGIVGICGDSEMVLKEAVETTYKSTLKCIAEECQSTEESIVHEENLTCNRSTAESMVDFRAKFNIKTSKCEKCSKKTAVKKFVMETPPPCFVAAWCPMGQQAAPGQENLIVRPSCCKEFKFKLSVVIASHQNKIVCMFREGHNYYRVEGHNPKQIQASEWLNVKPRLALFARQPFSDPGGSSSVRVPPFSGAGGSTWQGRKRRRGEDAQCAGGGRARVAPPISLTTEVIELNDDDLDGEVIPTGGGVAGDPRSSGGSGRSNDCHALERRHLDAGEGGGTRNSGETANEKQSSDDMGGRRMKGTPLELLSVDAEEEPLTDKADDVSDIGGENGGRSDERERAAGTGAARARGEAKGYNTASRMCIDTKAADSQVYDRSRVDEPSRKRSSNGSRRPTAPVSSSPLGPWIRLGGSWGGDDGGGDAVDRGCSAIGMAGNKKRERRFFEILDRKAQSHEDLTTGDGGSKLDDDDDVQVVTGRTYRQRESGAGSLPSRTARAVESGRNGGDDVDEIGSRRYVCPSGDDCDGATVPTTFPPDSQSDRHSSDQPSFGSESKKSRAASVTAVTVAAATTGPVASSLNSQLGRSFDLPMGSAASSLRHPQSAQSRLDRQREVHSVDDAFVASPPLARVTRTSGVGMPFIGPARPPLEVLPPMREQLSDAQLKEYKTRASEKYKNTRTQDASVENRLKQRTLSLAWKRVGPLPRIAPDSGDASGKVERRLSGSGVEVDMSRNCSAEGGGGGRGEEQAMEDLTGADAPPQEAAEEKDCGGWVSGLGRRSDEATLTTIRGINLRQDHFDRIVDSGGWLTSQIIDIRVKQLQEKYPQNLYFDSSFFGFLCPATEKRGGAFIVDYGRVQGWTKSSRLPAGKSSLFDLRKLFIPINQGNVHWVLVVVDMERCGGGAGDGGDSGKVVSFFDSFGRDGTHYVEAVQEYLVSELSSRDKTRQLLFTTESRPPSNAPRQHNSSDCGVLMLHVMEELSTGGVDGLTRLSQEEIMSLRLQLVANIRE